MIETNVFSGLPIMWYHLYLKIDGRSCNPIPFFSRQKTTNVSPQSAVRSRRVPSVSLPLPPRLWCVSEGMIPLRHGDVVFASTQTSRNRVKRWGRIFACQGRVEDFFIFSCMQKRLRKITIEQTPFLKGVVFGYIHFISHKSFILLPFLFLAGVFAEHFKIAYTVFEFKIKFKYVLFVFPWSCHNPTVFVFTTRVVKPESFNFAQYWKEKLSGAESGSSSGWSKSLD